MLVKVEMRVHRQVREQTKVVSLTGTLEIPKYVCAICLPQQNSQLMSER